MKTEAEAIQKLIEILGVEHFDDMTALLNAAIERIELLNNEKEERITFQDSVRVMREWIIKNRPDILEETEIQWDIQARYLSEGRSLVDAEEEVKRALEDFRRPKKTGEP